MSVARRRRYARVSIHAPRVGERPGNAASGNRQAGFNPRSPRGGATSVDRIAAQIYTVSIHAPRVGERPSRNWSRWRSAWFQSTLPAWGSDHRGTGAAGAARGFNPRSPRGGATLLSIATNLTGEVSIHAPRVGERRVLRARRGRHHAGFNPRSPRGGATCGFHSRLWYWQSFNPRSPRGGATRISFPIRSRSAFQSTLPAWGSDKEQKAIQMLQLRFNPRSPRGGATTQERLVERIALVSIHAPRVGERRRSSWAATTPAVFQSTLPAWGSDPVARPGPQRGAVSIHAPRVGERRLAGLNVAVVEAFQSTLPAWGSDSSQSGWRPCPPRFNPRSPRGGATLGLVNNMKDFATFQSTLPAWGSDKTRNQRHELIGVSIHAPRVGERHAHHRVTRDVLDVSIHAPRVGERRSARGGRMG